ncbi:MAG: type II secretion system protein [Bacillota bacterium]|nr:type II secretion system protein [Bacillota bacterium]
MKTLKEKKGFTMVEMVVAMSILVVIIGVTCGIMLSSSNAYARTAALDHAKELGLMAYDYVSRPLTYAMKVEIGSDVNGYPKGIKIEDGRLYYRPEGGEFSQAYTEGVYNGMELEMELALEGSLVRLRMVVLREGTALFEKSSSFRLLNAEAAPQGAASGPEEPVTNPSIFWE